MATTNNKIQKQTGPKSVEELQRKGPPTREEIEAISEKYGMGVALTPDENDRYLQYFTQRRNANDIATFLGVCYPQCEWSIQADGRMNKLPEVNKNVPMGTIKEKTINDLNAVVWDEDNPLPKPTMAEFDKLRPFVQDILDQEAYIDLRAKAYPRENELVKALWEYVVEGDDELMHALQARRLAVKKRFPKPENKHWMVQSSDYLKIIPNSPEDILRDLDEKEAKEIAFKPGVQAKDAEPLATTKSLSERADEIIAKRVAAQKDRDVRVSKTENIVAGTTSNPTVKDIEKAKADKEKAEKSK